MGARGRALALATLMAAGALITLAPPTLASPGPGHIVLAQEGDTESVGGTLTDAEGEPVAGVTILIETADGDPVGEAVSGGDGAWSATLPGPGDYRATLLEDTLPDELGLRNPERATLEFSMRPGQSRTMLFPLGEGVAVGRAFTGRFFQALINGIMFGLIIAMTALGLSLIFGTTGLINFAHGELVTFGAVVAFFFNASRAFPMSLHLALAGLLAVVAGAGLGYVLERGLWRPLRARKVGLFQMLVISIGLMLVLRHIIVIFFGSRSRPFVGFAVQAPIQVGPLRLTPRDLIITVLSLLILLVVAGVLERTRLGKAMRAVADNRNLAESSGIDVQRIILLIWIAGGALAAGGGVFLGTVENVSWLMGFRLLLLMFAGVILGGLGTAYGAMVGSLVVGLVTEMSVLWFSSELKFVWALLALIVILLVRPQGILGVKERIG